VAADRDAYAARQAAFLDALRGGPAPGGFDADDVAAAGAALISKRARAVREAWPALYHGLADRFPTAFAAYARATSPPADGFVDGFAFASGLDGADRAALPEPARVELALARAVLVPGAGSGPRRRRGAYLAVVRLRRQRGLLVVIHLPGGAHGHATLALPSLSHHR
jgi:hypothetical protein